MKKGISSRMVCFSLICCSRLQRGWAEYDSFIQIAHKMVRDSAENKHRQVHPDNDGQKTAVQRQTSVNDGAPKASSSG